MIFEINGSEQRAFLIKFSATPSSGVPDHHLQVAAQTVGKSLPQNCFSCFFDAKVSTLPIILSTSGRVRMTLATAPAPIKVYGLGPSTCTARVLAAIFEKEVQDWELVRVNIMAGEHKQPEFLSKQPFGQIPVLEDEDLVLFESRAINRYIANRYEGQGTDLLGKTIKEKALVENWLEVESQTFDPPIKSIVFQLVFAKWFGKETDREVISAALPKLEAVLDIYEARLSKSKYLAGDFFSLVEVAHLPYLHYLVNVAQVSDPVTSRKHVLAWFQDITSRPAWKKYLALVSAAQ